MDLTGGFLLLPTVLLVINMSVLVQTSWADQTLWADHSRCDLEFEDWSEIFENQTEGPTMTDWNQSLTSRPAELEAGQDFMLPPRHDEEEDDDADEDEADEEDEAEADEEEEDGADEVEDDEDEGLTAATRSPPIPYRLVWMDDGNDGLTSDPDPRSSLRVGGLSALDALEVLDVEQEVRGDTRW